MRIKLATVLLAGIALFSIAFAANAAISLDSVLVEINSSAWSDFGNFRTEISLGFNIPAPRVEYYFTEYRMTPADIYMAAELSYVVGIPVERVVQVYRVHRRRGWGYVAGVMGVKPGSREFMRIKERAYDFHGKMKHRGKKKRHGWDGD